MDNKVRTEKLKVIVGLGKTGLSCARYLGSRGEAFKVVDSRSSPPCLELFLQEFPGCDVELGNFSEATFCNASELLVSPGISLKTTAIVNARLAGVPVTGDIDVFSKEVKAPIIAVTGSNGKSTVVSLLADIFRKAGIDFGLGGNLDGEQARPALDMLAEPQKDFYILELSSFQLETTKKLNAEVAVILNVCEDHMDRYENFDAYVRAKQRVFNGCKRIVVNKDNRYSQPPADVDAQVLEYGVSDRTTNGFGVLESGGEEFIAFNLEKILDVKDLKVFGQHNVSNVLAAMTIARAMGIELEAIKSAVLEFKGLPNRCQWVAQIKGVDFYNDSKGTNVGATVAAVEGLGQKLKGRIVLIAGGVSKGADFSALSPVLNKWVKEVILIGQDAMEIAAVLDSGMGTYFAGDMEDAVNTALEHADAGDAVLLSPASASFDMFDDFNHRGRVFTDSVRSLQCQ